MADDEGALPDAFWAVSRRLRQLGRHAMAPWDVSPSQGRALAVLARHGGMRPGELSEHLRIAARSTTEVVDGLEERGLVVRSPDPDDRRATRVEVTGEGSRVAAAIRNARDARTDRFFAALDERDRAELARLLRVLSEQDGA